MSEVRIYPRQISAGTHKINLRAMTAEDEAEVLSFGRALPNIDLLFLRRDITEPKVVAKWVQDTLAGDIVTLLALSGGRVVGCSAIVADRLSWSKHVGELRVLVLPELRGTGLGRTLAQEAFAHAIEAGMERLTAQIADTLQEVLRPRGVAVMVEATHACMTTRGVNAREVVMTTSRLLGAFRENPATRREFFAAIGK